MKSQTETYQKVILCVGGQPEAFQALRDILRHLPYRILCAVSGAQTLAVLGTIKPDLILADMQTPRLGGFELIKMLKKHGLDRVPLVTITDDNLPRSEPEYYEGGTNYHISKPFDNLQILNIVDHLIGGRDNNSR